MANLIIFCDFRKAFLTGCVLNVFGRDYKIEVLLNLSSSSINPKTEVLVAKTPKFVIGDTVVVSRRFNGNDYFIAEIAELVLSDGPLPEFLGAYRIKVTNNTNPVNIVTEEQLSSLH